MEYQKTPKHLSASAISQFVRCPGCWHRKYVEKDEQAASVTMTYGRVMAYCLEALHNDRPDLPKVVDAVYSSAAERLARHGLTLVPSKYHTRDLLDAYNYGYRMHGKPEKKFQLKHPEFPVPIIGYMDLETQRNNRPYGIAEFKTTQYPKSWNQARADTEIQGTVYWMQFLENYGFAPKHLTYIIMSQNESDQTLIQEFETKRNQGDIDALIGTTQGVWDSILNGEFPELCQRCRSRNQLGIGGL